MSTNLQSNVNTITNSKSWISIKYTIDIKDFCRKTLIWSISAIISFIPIIGVALLPILKGERSSDTFFSSVIQNSDVMYVCVALTVVAISDTVWAEQGHKGLVKVCMMFQLVTLVLGSFAYALFKSGGIKDNYMGSVNKWFFIMMFLLNMLAYIALSIKKSKEIK